MIRAMSQQAVFDNGVNAAAELFHDDEIHELKDDQYQSDEPDAETLLEVFLEGFEEGTGDVGFLVPNHFHRHIVHGGDGRSDGDDGDAAEQEEKVQDNKIRHPAHEGEKFVVHVENTVHNKTPICDKILTPWAVLLSHAFSY